MFIAAMMLYDDLLTNSPISEILIDFVLLVGPGSVLLYGGYWLLRSDLRPDIYPRITGWCFGGLAVMFVVFGLLVLNPDSTVTRTVRSASILTAFGCVGGLTVGLKEARALTRAAEAEEREQALRNEQRFIENLVETAPIGIATLDRNGRFDFLNEQIEEIFGYSPADIGDYETRTNLFDLKRPDGTRLAPEEIPAYRIIEKGETVDDGPIGLERPDGEYVWLLVSGKPIRDDDERKAVLTFTDVTDQVEYERKLRTSNERLEQFAYAASHDLQEPLRMVSSYLQLIERRYEHELNEDGKEYLEYAVDGADRMREMIQSLLDYSRVDQRGADFEPVELDAVLAAVREDLRVRIEESDAEITADSLPTVHGDEKQLRQLFQNLLENAITYSGEEPPQIDISAERDGDEWVVSVEDGGIGIDQNHADRIFEVFESLHAPADHSGTGIGLALCERIVERHGGEIWVDSEPGDGSTFSFTLPTQEQDRGPLTRSADA